jgi:hypothetical protein
MAHHQPIWVESQLPGDVGTDDGVVVPLESEEEAGALPETSRMVFARDPLALHPTEQFLLRRPQSSRRGYDAERRLVVVQVTEYAEPQWVVLPVEAVRQQHPL